MDCNATDDDDDDHTYIPACGISMIFLMMACLKRAAQNIIFKHSNIYPTRCNVTQFILSGNCSTCFGWYHQPSSGAQTTVSTASGMCYTIMDRVKFTTKVHIKI